MPPRRWMRTHPILLFVLVGFGWTWGWDLIFFAFDLWEVIPVTIPRVWGPAIAALAVIWASRVSLGSWIRQRLTWKVPSALFVVALAIPLFITNVQPLIESLGGGSLVYDSPRQVFLLVVFLLVQLLVFGPTEELGWRGIVQPQLQQERSVFTTGLTVGIMWWAWHLPLFFSGNPNYSLELAPFVSYALFVWGASIVFGAFVNITDGRLLPVMVMHGSVNLGAVVSAEGGLLTGSPLIPLIGSGLWWVIVALLVARYGLSMTPPDYTVQTVEGLHG